MTGSNDWHENPMNAGSYNLGANDCKQMIGWPCMCMRVPTGRTMTGNQIQRQLDPRLIEELMNVWQ
jgi:hypothetical protein